MGRKWLYFLISAVVIVPGIWAILTGGLKPSIDFTGGTMWELRFGQNVSSRKGEIVEVIQNNGGYVDQIQSSASQTYRVRMKFITQEESVKLLNALNARFGKVEQVRFGTVGPTLGQELIWKTVVGILLASTTILIYLAFVFRNLQYGVSAILAVVHDTLVVVGLFALFGKFLNVEIDTLFVTAVLTVISFSVHDTVVVYDRIRESQKRMSQSPINELANKAVTETMSRSLNNSLTIIFMLLALVLLGGETIRWFAVALLIGTISGTYSSPFTAVPILAIWQGWRENRVRGSKTR